MHKDLLQPSTSNVTSKSYLNNQPPGRTAACLDLLNVREYSFPLQNSEDDLLYHDLVTSY